MVLTDRSGAGRKSARRLLHLRDEPVVVLGLPQGGVPVAFEIATAVPADELIFLVTPERFITIGEDYADFSQTSDDEVVGCLERAGREAAATRSGLSRQTATCRRATRMS